MHKKAHKILNALLLLVGILLLSLIIQFAAADNNGNEGQLKIMELEGIYKGENPVIQNPYIFTHNSLCVKEIQLNKGVAIKDPEQQKFIVSLRSFEIGEYVHITIKHLPKCKPRLMNPKAILGRSTFELVSIKVESGYLKWTTDKETNQQPYIIEQLKYNKWVPVDKVIANGTEGYNNYKVSVKLYSGINKFRLKQRDATNYYRYTELVEHDSDKTPVTFYPTRVDDYLHFSEPTDYEIFDDYGMLIKKGEGKDVEVSSLKPGVYYMHLDNRTEKFLKK